MPRPLILTLLLLGYAVVVYFGLRPAQLSLWNSFGVADLSVIACFTVPFVIFGWFSPATLASGRWAWRLGVLMTLDLPFLAVAVWAPTGGHPSLEALAALLIGESKVVLVPAVLLLLSRSYLRGAGLPFVALGFVAAIGHTLYSLGWSAVGFGSR